MTQAQQSTSTQHQPQRHPPGKPLCSKLDEKWINHWYFFLFPKRTLHTKHGQTSTFSTWKKNGLKYFLHFAALKRKLRKKKKKKSSAEKSFWISKGNMAWMVSPTRPSGWKAKGRAADAQSADTLLKSGRGTSLGGLMDHFDKMLHWLRPSAPVCRCEKPTGAE